VSDVLGDSDLEHLIDGEGIIVSVGAGGVHHNAVELVEAR